jgi:DNA-binding transcriptional regulator LsrR (DeoR family)
VIGVAGGPDKRQAIHAALRGGLIDVLVTDRESAERLLAG